MQTFNDHNGRIIEEYELTADYMCNMDEVGKALDDTVKRTYSDGQAKTIVSSLHPQCGDI